MHGVPVELAAGAGVVFGGARVRVAGDDLCVDQGHAGSQDLVIAAYRSECGLMWRGMPAALATRVTGMLPGLLPLVPQAAVRRSVYTHVQVFRASA